MRIILVPMKQCRQLLSLLIITGILFIPVKIFFDFKQPQSGPVALQNTVTPCPHQQSVSASCASVSYYLQTETSLQLNPIILAMAGLLCFILSFSLYRTPITTIYRPPMYR